MTDKKPIIYVPWITRGDLKIAPAVYFVFGDNAARRGLGGQAREMRGEPNALGVATKRRPTNEEDSFFSDECETDFIILSSDLMTVVGLWNAGHQIVAPTAGIGTERARLKEKAPKLYNLIIDTFRQMSGDDYPWS